MPKKSILSLTSLNRSQRADVQFGVILALVAGAVNAGGFLAIGVYTSHMSGIAASIGTHAIRLEWLDIAWAVGVLAAFICGSLTCSVIIQVALHLQSSLVFAWPLLLEATLMALFGLNVKFMYLEVGWVVALLGFIMGLQNAMITNISKAVIRTTHITGVATDIGIETGRLIASKIIHKKIDFRQSKLITHLLLFSSFIAGGIVGAFAFMHTGYVMIMVLAALLGLFACIPILDHHLGRRKQRPG